MIGVLAVVVLVAVIRLNLPKGRGETRQSALTLPAVRDSAGRTMPRVAVYGHDRRGRAFTFVHENGADGDKLLPETMGGGCASSTTTATAISISCS